MKVRKRSLNEVESRPAPNRKIREFFSSQTLGAKAVTFRVVDMLPVSQQEPRKPHAHPDFEEVIYVISGRGKFWVEGEWHNIKEGDALLVPAGVMHATFNTTDEPLRLASFFPVAEGVDQTRMRADVFVSLDSDSR